MSATTKPCPSCAHPLPLEAAFCMMCGSQTPQAIDKHTGENKTYSSADRLPSQDKVRLQRALGTNYELGKLIGRGGFAEVFLVHDKRLKRDLALKALRPDLMLSDQLLTRFRREAETVAALRHPHIVPIYDIGEADGIAYILMPLIQGESLRALLLREGPRPPREAGRILLEAADALEAAHEAGVVHRDIKPENIMLEGKGRRVQLMDFGIAKAIDTSDTTPGLTSTGMLVGTPHYMSPEQAAGDLHLDHRSDQYSLAVVGFQMITGSLPFDGESTRAVLFQQMVGVPKSLRDLVPDVPAPLAFAVDRALAKDPKERFVSMATFAEAMSGPDALPLGAPVVETPAVAPPVPTLISEQPRPSRSGAAWLPWAGLGAAGVAVVFLLMRNGAPAPPPPAPAPVAPATVAPPPGPSPTTVSAPPSPTLKPPAPGAKAPVKRPDGTGAATSTKPEQPLAGLNCQTAIAGRKWTEAVRLCGAEGDRGSAASSRALATLYQKGTGVDRSDSAAATWFRKAAGAGDAQSAFRLGVMYATGVGVTQNDVEATTLIRKAADAGIEDAWPLIAERFEQGLGTKRSDQEAATWYRKAAEAGNKAAQYNLGEMFSRGRGVEKNEQEAAKWFSKAAEQGHPGAEYQFGMMYIRGRGGLAKDEEVGLQWLDRAAAQGHEDAKKEVAKRRRP